MESLCEFISHLHFVFCELLIYSLSFCIEFGDVEGPKGNTEDQNGLH